MIRGVAPATTAAVAVGSVAIAVGGGVAVVVSPILLPAIAALVGSAVVTLLPVVGYVAIAAISATGLTMTSLGGLAAVTAGLVGLTAIVGLNGSSVDRYARTPLLFAALAAYLLVSFATVSFVRGDEWSPLPFAAVGGLTLGPYFLSLGMARSFRAIDAAMLATYGIAVALAVVHVLAAPAIATLGSDGGELAQSLNRNRNTVGAVYLLALAYALPRIGSPSRGRSLLLLTGVGILTVALLASLSRSSYLGGLLLVSIFVVTRRNRLGRVLVVSAIIATLFLLTGASGILDDAIARTTGTVSGGTLDTSAGARIDLWVAAVRAFEMYPVFGIGFHNFAPNLPALWTGSVSNLAVVVETPSFAYAHNLVLTVLSQGGIVGGALLLAAFVTLTRDAFRSSGVHRDTALLALSAMATVSLFGEPLLVPAVAVPFLLTNAAARADRGPSP